MLTTLLSGPDEVALILTLFSDQSFSLCDSMSPVEAGVHPLFQ